MRPHKIGSHSQFESVLKRLSGSRFSLSKFSSGSERRMSGDRDALNLHVELLPPDASDKYVKLIRRTRTSNTSKRYGELILFQWILSEWTLQTDRAGKTVNSNLVSMFACHLPGQRQFAIAFGSLFVFVFYL